MNISKIIDTFEMYQKVIGEILQVEEDKAKLRHELDLLKEEIAGWKKLHEKRSSSMKMMTTLVRKQEDLAKLRIKHLAAVKHHHVVVEEMMHARLDKSRVMDTMKKMAKERHKEMKVVEAMKKQLGLRAQQPFISRDR